MDNIKFNKLLNEKYFLLQDIARKYNYSEELLDMITFIYFGFYMDFGKKCASILYDIFNRVKIIYEEGNVHEIAIRHNMQDVSDGVAAITIFEPNFDVFKDSNSKQNSQTILLGTHVKEFLITPIFKLETLAHEVRHILMRYYNTNILLDENTYYMRSGLQEIYYVKNDSMANHFSITRKGMVLDEVLNTYITGILVNRILSLKKYKIENNNLKRFLDLLTISHPDKIYVASAYLLEIKLLNPLLMCDLFINLVNQHQFDGEIVIIKEFIEHNIDACNYEQFCELLDTIYRNNKQYPQEVQNSNLDFVYNHIKDVKRAKSVILELRKNIDMK